MPSLLIAGLLSTGLVSGGLVAAGRAAPPAAVTLARPLAHHLRLALDPASGELRAGDEIELAVAGGVRGARGLFLHRALDVESVAAGGQAVDFRLIETPDLPRLLGRSLAGDDARRAWRDARLLAFTLPAVAAAEDGTPRWRLQVRYAGRVGRRPPRDATVTPPACAADSLLFLARQDHWYPHGDADPATFDLRVRVPAPYAVVTEGRRVRRQATGDSVVTIWSERHPVAQAYLLAGRCYRVRAARHGNVDLYTFLLPQHEQHADSLIAAAAAHLDAFAAAYGDYPRDKLALVETRGPAALALPSVIALGSDLLAHPQLAGRPLAHEILHCWWGEAVIPAPGGGNWAEGLVADLADHGMTRARGGAVAARAWRRDALMRYRDWQAGRPPEVALARFSGGRTPAARALGYGKGAMVFHMLERLVGRTSLERVLRRLYAERAYTMIGWRDIAAACSRAVGERLDWFFEQWVERPGAPALQLAAAAREPGPGGRWAVRLTLEQPATPLPYRLAVPVVLETAAGPVERILRIDAGRQELVARCGARPLALRVDPDYHLFRQLAPGEVPPTIRALRADPRLLVILPGSPQHGTGPLYERFAAHLATDTMRGVLRDLAWRDAFRGRRQVLLLGGPEENIITAGFVELWEAHVRWTDLGFRVDGRTLEAEGDAVVAVDYDPLHPGYLIGVVAAGSAAALARLERQLPYHEGTSYVAFHDGRSVAAGLREPDGTILRKELE